MHQHDCRHCGDKFICDEPADECFRDSITCQECFLKRDFRLFLIFCFFSAVVIVAVLYFPRVQNEKPAMSPSPVSHTLNLEN